MWCSQARLNELEEEFLFCMAVSLFLIHFCLKNKKKFNSPDKERIIIRYEDCSVAKGIKSYTGRDPVVNIGLRVNIYLYN